MNIVFLLGNGFDINLGMKTRYPDFYRYFKEKESSSHLVKNLQNSITENIINWSDLELALGEYTSEFDTVAEFDEVYDYLLNALCDYLDEEFSKYDFGTLSISEFFKNLSIPEKFLTVQDATEVVEYKNKWKQSNKLINIISFNYTRSVEKIIEGTKNNHLGTFDNTNYYLQNIIHIHGFTDDRTILGVNDPSQVSNISFHKDSDFIEALIKIESNARQRHNIDKNCINLINSSDIIYIFGCSLGATDKFWWKLVADNLKRGIKVIIFFRAEEQNQRLGHRPLRIQRMVKKMFWEMADMSDEEKEIYDKNLYIKINAEIFNLF